MQYKRILLIDDDEDDQEIFQLALSEVCRDIQCKVMSSAQEALRHLEENQTSTELIFLDLNMPIMSGQQFLSELLKRKELSRIPVIILSTSSDRNTITNAESLGASKFFTKPSDIRELKKILQDILT